MADDASEPGPLSFAAHTEASTHIQDILARAPDLFADGGDIVVDEAVPGGETTEGSIAAHAAG